MSFVALGRSSRTWREESQLAMRLFSTSYSDIPLKCKNTLELSQPATLDLQRDTWYDLLSLLPHYGNRLGSLKIVYPACKGWRIVKSTIMLRCDETGRLAAESFERNAQMCIMISTQGKRHFLLIAEPAVMCDGLSINAVNPEIGCPGHSEVAPHASALLPELTGKHSSQSSTHCTSRFS